MPNKDIIVLERKLKITIEALEEIRDGVVCEKIQKFNKEGIEAKWEHKIIAEEALNSIKSL